MEKADCFCSGKALEDTRSALQSFDEAGFAAARVSPRTKPKLLTKCTSEAPTRSSRCFAFTEFVNLLGVAGRHK
jgi:hypothetical protein